jgi:hypothetical protein
MTASGRGKAENERAVRRDGVENGDFAGPASQCGNIYNYPPGVQIGGRYGAIKRIFQGWRAAGFPACAIAPPARSTVEVDGLWA